MKIKKLALAVAVTLITGIGVTAYAETSSSTASAETYQKGSCTGLGIGRITNLRGYDIITNLLKSKGLTDSDINSSINSGKTLNEIAKEQGLTDEQLRDYMVDERIKEIDDAVASGKLTKEQGEEAKTNMKQNSAACTTPGQMNDRMNAGNKGRMGMGMMSKGNFDSSK